MDYRFTYNKIEYGYELDMLMEFLFSVCMVVLLPICFIVLVIICATCGILFIGSIGLFGAAIMGDPSININHRIGIIIICPTVWSIIAMIILGDF